jgi:hypothetical protein
MQLDLDVLAVSDINDMFPWNERLWAAPSDLRMLDWRHAWTLLPRWRRAVHKFSGWRMDDTGVSASVIASATTAWDRASRKWDRQSPTELGFFVPRCPAGVLFLHCPPPQA